MNYHNCIAAVVIVLASRILAETSNPPVPGNPVLHRAPDFASWTIQFEYPDENATAKSDAPTSYIGDRVRILTVTKTGNIYREATILASEKTCEKWIFDTVQLKTRPGISSIVPILPPTAGNPDSEYSDYSKSDFPELSWVSLSNYKGVVSYQGVSVFRFESGEKVALLSLESQMPLRFSDGKISRIYTYNLSPAAPLPVPEEFAKALEIYKQAQEKLKYHPVPM